MCPGSAKAKVTRRRRFRRQAVSGNKIRTQRFAQQEDSMSDPHDPAPSIQPLPSTPTPPNDNKPSGIAADDVGASSMAERVAREADDAQVSPREKAQLGAEISRDEDA
jgi:hypothetical protein